MSEADLYPDIKNWFKYYLQGKFQSSYVETTEETARRYLDEVLQEKGIYIHEAVGVKIKIDIVGIIKKKNQQPQVAFVEVKDKSLTLKDLGQLWGYTKLINPVESFLVSSKGTGSLERIINHYNRHDILRYGSNNERLMQIAKWDTNRKTIDYSSLMPKF